MNEHESNQMPTDNAILKVAVDDGSGNIAYAMNGAEGYTPSIIERGTKLGGFGASRSTWECKDGKVFTVRKLSDAPENTCNREYQISSANRVLVIDTLANAGLGGRHIEIGCTIPTAQFFNSGDDSSPIDTLLIESKRRSLLEPVVSKFGDKESPIIDKVTVYPEAIPAYFYVTRNEDGSPKEEYENDVKTLVVDLGRYSNDLAVIGTDFEILSHSTTDNGIHKFISHFHTLLHKHSIDLGVDAIKTMSITDIEYIIKQGFIGSNATSEAAIAARIDVKPLINETAKYLSDLIMNDIISVTGNNINTLTRVIFVGGGAYWLKDESANWFHTVVIPDRPEMAIVRGVKLLLDLGA